jgi:hypothetical protein
MPARSLRLVRKQQYLRVRCRTVAAATDSDSAESEWPWLWTIYEISRVLSESLLPVTLSRGP